MKRISYLIYFTILICVSFSCKKETSEGKNSLIDFVAEPKGDNCPSGGYKVISGLDQNGNNVLEASEIIESRYICNGNDGDNSITNFIPEPAGENCEAGGFMIITGLDSDNNNVLSENEITTNEYLCNGNDGNMYSDNLIRLVIAHAGIVSWDTVWSFSGYPTYNFPDFNKYDFQGVDSILFVPSMHTDYENNTCFVELFNITDSIPIQGTLLESNSTGWNFHYSRNIYDYLPNKKINIGIRIKSETVDKGVSTGIVSYLYIYKH